MLKDLLNHPEFQDKVEEMRTGLSNQILSQATSEEDRNEALTKYHLIDWLMGELSAPL